MHVGHECYCAPLFLCRHPLAPMGRGAATFPMQGLMRREHLPQVGVRVEEEDVKTGSRHHCCSAYLTFVSVLARPGRDGRPARRMKRVIPTLPTHTEIHDAAER